MKPSDLSVCMSGYLSFGINNQMNSHVGLEPVIPTSTTGTHE